MGPQQPRFNGFPEQPRANPNTYQAPAPQKFDRLPAVMPERHNEQISAGSEIAPLQQGLTLPALPTTVIATPQPSDSNTSSVQAPVTAADEDLIETEWVKRVKEVVQETRDDPYQREHQINQLKREYIFKRYGRRIGDAGD